MLLLASVFDIAFLQGVVLCQCLSVQVKEWFWRWFEKNLDRQQSNDSSASEFWASSEHSFETETLAMLKDGGVATNALI